MIVPNMLDLAAIFAAFPVLETPRFLLQEIEASDAPAWYRILRDVRVARYSGRQPISQLSEAEERIERTRAGFRDQAGIRWAITDRSSGSVLGTAGTWRLLQEHFRGEIGYELHPDFWGKGVMHESLTALLDFAFGRISLHSVEGQMHPGNAASQRALERLGFVREGYFRENYFDHFENGFTDTAVYSLLRSTWAERNDCE